MMFFLHEEGLHNLVFAHTGSTILSKLNTIKLQVRR